jgi:ABC-type glycerol-3-phosphate transport system substrate-binding protein
MDEWIAIPYPGVTTSPVINLYGPAFAILKSTPEKQLAAWLFIKWMTQPENQVPFIKASGYLPTRASTMDLMDGYARINPQWAAAQNLISHSRAEPRFGSWGVARWVISDAVLELIKPDFQSEHIPLLLKDLDAILAEIHIQNR